MSHEHIELPLAGEEEPIVPSVSASTWWMSFFAPRRCEQDSGFRNTLLRHSRTGLRVAGVLGIFSSLLAITIYAFVFGRQMSWSYVSPVAGSEVVITDKLVILALGVVCLALSSSRRTVRLGRFAVGAMVIAAAIASTIDDTSRGDLKFSTGYITLICLGAIGTMPFRAWHVFLLGASVTTGFFLTVYMAQGALAQSFAGISSDYAVYFIIMTLVLTGIGGLIYHTRYQQYLARKTADQLRRQFVRSERKYRSLFRDATDAVYVMDNASGRFLMANPALEELLNVDAEHLSEHHFSEFVHPDDRERVLGYHLARREGRPAPSRYTFKATVRGSDEPRIAELIVHHSDDPEVSMGAIRDITELINSRETIRQYAGELESANRQLRGAQAQLAQSQMMACLGNLVAGVSHEMNTPLGVLKSSHELYGRSLNRLWELLRNEESRLQGDSGTRLAQLQGSLESLNSSCRSAIERMARIVVGLNRFSRLDRARKDRFDIHEGIDSALALLEGGLDERIEVRKEYGPVEPFLCFPNQLNVALANLLMNARDAIETRGCISIKTQVRLGDLVVEIADTGKGMSAEELKRLFEPGFTTKGTGVGLGLGLSIVHRVMQNHNGAVEVESAAGKGSTFRLVLPLSMKASD